MASFDVKSEPTSSIDMNDSELNLNSSVADLDQLERVDEQDQLSIEGEERASAAGCNSKFETGFALINEGREICLRGMKKHEKEELKQIISQLQDQLSKNENDNENKLKEATNLIREHERRQARREADEELTRKTEENERLQEELRRSSNIIWQLERENQGFKERLREVELEKEEFRVEARIRKAVEEERAEQTERYDRAQQESKALQDQLRDAFDTDRKKFAQDLALKDKKILEFQQTMKSKREAETKMSAPKTVNACESGSGRRSDRAGSKHRREALPKTAGVKILAAGGQETELQPGPHTNKINAAGFDGLPLLIERTEEVAAWIQEMPEARRRSGIGKLWFQMSEKKKPAQAGENNKDKEDQASEEEESSQGVTGGTGQKALRALKNASTPNGRYKRVDGVELSGKKAYEEDNGGRAKKRKYLYLKSSCVVNVKEVII